KLSAVPLGGYVKFYGDDGQIEPALSQFTFMAQSILKRVLIVSAGPVFNFIFAVFLFALIYFIGEPNVAPVLGQVEYESDSWNAGIRENDEIVEVNGVAINTWIDVEENIDKTNADLAHVVVRRMENLYQYDIPTQTLISRNKFGELQKKKQLAGISPQKRSATVGISDENSPAYKAGFRTGDLIVSADDKKIDSWTGLEDFLLSNFGQIQVKVKRQEEELVFTLNNRPEYKRIDERIYRVESERLIDNYHGIANTIGFYPVELFVQGFSDTNSPAAKAGILEGDRIVAINGVFVRGFNSLMNISQKGGEQRKELKIILERNGRLVTAEVLPELKDIEIEEIGHKEQRFLLGILTYPELYPGPVTKKNIVIRNPFKLLMVSVQKTAYWMWITLVGLFKLLTGSISLKVLGGPLMLGKIAGDSLALGIVFFFKMMAIISINLGLINLFPIPILDGGHLVFFTIEAIRRKPLKEKYMEVAQQVGFFMLITLMFIAFYNDILRYGSGILGLFK
ncbi:MAG: RIP metalloprotease RseP, partial [Oligoflexia bacterium]|nr:RIP metalloprotease RseP [Oligoflexia bacterium]